MKALARFAAADRTPVFGVAGPGWRDRLEDLALDDRLDLVSSPRHASLLLVAGAIPERHREALARVHDQIPHPRATVRWKTRGGDAEIGSTVDDDADPVETMLRRHRDLLLGRVASEDPLLPDEPPHPWRGKGEHGQGGEGMMGGTPYGRRMAMTGEDVRDGLALDRLPFTIGPFFPLFPPGLELEVVLQGDAIQEAEVVSEPYPQSEGDPVRRELRRLHRILRVLGARALADRALRRAVAGKPVESDLEALHHRARRAGLGSLLSPLEEPSARNRRLPAAGRLRLLEEILPGMEWSRAVVTIVALDLAPSPPAEGSP